MKIKDMIYIAMMSVVIVVCSWISIPFTIPITLQTFAIFSALLLLGGKKGTFSILLYILLGAVGLPVFAGFKSGVAALMGPTGGYILGFIICGLIYWILENKCNKLIPIILGNILCYVFGTIWFVCVYAAKNNPISFAAAFVSCVVPYILPDAAKITLAVLVSGRVKKLIK